MSSVYLCICCCLNFALELEIDDNDSTAGEKRKIYSFPPLHLLSVGSYFRPDKKSLKVRWREKFISTTTKCKSSRFCSNPIISQDWKNAAEDEEIFFALEKLENVFDFFRRIRERTHL